MKKPMLWIGLAFVAALIAILYQSSTGLATNRVEICVSYQGRDACRIASAATKEEAQRTALSNACAQVASGMNDTLSCERNGPTKITWLAAN